VEQAQRAEGDGDEEQRLGHFEGRNENEPAIMAWIWTEELGGEFDRTLGQCGPCAGGHPIDTLNDGGEFSQPETGITG